jgi:hypothetical protein
MCVCECVCLFSVLVRVAHSLCRKQKETKGEEASAERDEARAAHNTSTETLGADDPLASDGGDEDTEEQQQDRTEVKEWQEAPPPARREKYEIVVAHLALTDRELNSSSDDDEDEREDQHLGKHEGDADDRGKAAAAAAAET